MEPVCKFWNTERGCRKGDRCKWIHPNQTIKEWTPKKPMAIPEDNTLYTLYKITKPVIIHGPWADVEDTDPFF